MKWLVSLLCIMIGLSLHAQVDLTPIMTNPIKGSQYVIDYDIEDQIPETVYYILKKSELGNYGRYSFHIEMSNDSAHPDDYYGTGYDKGHMFSSASSNSYSSNYESFDMINILPQIPSFNRGLWKQSEVFERNNCDPYCYVICGIIRSRNDYRMGSVLVPSMFYKIIYNPEKNQMITFLFEQFDYGYLKDYVTTVDEIETKLNINLFHQLSISEQARLESSYSLDKWDF